MFVLSLTILDFGFILLMLYMAYESANERESRAVLISLLGTIFHLGLMYVILYVPVYQVIPVSYFWVMGFALLLLLILRKPNTVALNGIRGYVTGNAPRPDERDTITNRYRLVDGTLKFQEYYARHPEWEDTDRVNRKLNRIDGNIDGGYRPNLSLIDS